jgi:hypothetical protein
MGTVSLIIGILVGIGLAIGFIPCLGWFNWFNIPLAIIGLILGIIAMTQGDNKGIAGFVICAIVIVLGLVRLVLGGGIF